MAYRYILVLLLSLPTLLLAQPSGSTVVIGKVVDRNTNRPVGYATVAVVNASDDAVLEGTITDEGGGFEIVVRGADTYLEVSFIGYETIKLDDLQLSPGRNDIGVIAIGPDAQMLDEVVVRAEKSSTEFRLDKRIFNVGQDLSSTGASALEVLNNVPSVNVDIEGSVTLRGSAGVQILVDGRPSVLADEGNALGTITADMIDRVEVLTNPSAKYEAEGSSGIINIILKKNEKEGLNGSVTLNAGIPDNNSVGVSLNRRTKKLNLFSQAGVGFRELPRDVEVINIDRTSGQRLESTGVEFRNETYYNFILGSDYYINPNNVITLSGSFAYEVEDQPSETSFVLTDSDGSLLRQWQRTEVTDATNPKLQYELKYKREFTDAEDHILLFSAIGNYFGKDQSSRFSNVAAEGFTPIPDQLTATAFEEGKYTFNLDYTKPIDDTWTVETGAQYVTNNVSNDFEVQDEINGTFETDPGLTNVFQYDQKVLGLYATTAYEGDKWGVKGGLRAEYTDLGTLLENTGETNNQRFTSLFPSAYTSYKFSDRISLQAGYSRRIYRPRLWDLNPFFNIRNNFNIRAGNPDLLPQFTDSYEIGSIYILDKASFNLNLYQRYTTAVIDRISIFEDNVTIWKPFNIGTNRLTGVEYNFKYSPNKKLTFNGDANYNVFTRKGELNDQVFDFSADQWSGKLTGRYKISKALEIESTGRYNSRIQTIQGIRSANLFADFGMRYKLKDGRAVISASVRDIFASRIRENIIDQEDFYAYSFGQRGRFMSIGFSYGFGKGEAMEYSGRRRR